MKVFISALIILGLAGGAAGSDLKLSDSNTDNGWLDPIPMGPYCIEYTIENRPPGYVFVSKKLLDQLLRAAIPKHETPIFRYEDGITHFNTQALIQKLKTLELRIRALEFQGCGCGNN